MRCKPRGQVMPSRFIRDNPNSRAISRTENPSALVPVVPADPVLALLTEADMALGR